MGTRTHQRARHHTRRYPVGAELLGPSVVSVRVWAPGHRDVAVVIDGQSTRLEAQSDGYFAGHAPGRHGARYGFRLDDDPTILPDPASRWQPDGPEGLSAVVDLSAYRWSDRDWAGLSLDGQVLYEMHVGTFTPAGTWHAAAALLPRLRALASLSQAISTPMLLVLLVMVARMRFWWIPWPSCTKLWPFNRR